VWAIKIRIKKAPFCIQVPTREGYISLSHYYYYYYYYYHYYYYYYYYLTNQGHLAIKGKQRVHSIAPPILHTLVDIVCRRSNTLAIFRYRLISYYSNP